MTPATALPPDSPESCPRALHARLLANAAARRLRAHERARARRQDDARYWKDACPRVLAHATALREARSFAPLP